MKRWMLRVVVLGSTALGMLLVWGVALEPRWIDERVEHAAIPDLPEAWEGRLIGLIADLQVGMWLGNEDTARRIVSRLVEQRPGAVLIAGDFVYAPLDSDEELEEVRSEQDPDEVLEEVREVIELLRPLVDARIPTYAVLGNHDYAMSVPGVYRSEWVAEQVTRGLEDAGIKLLSNEALALPDPSGETRGPNGHEQLYLGGIGPSLPGIARPALALHDVPPEAPRIVFMHNPDAFAALPAGAAPLALAGHTHGGQVRFPFLPEWSWFSLVSDDEVRVDGWIKDYGADGNRLYVNRGIGFSVLPIRVNCRPELTYFRLTKGAGMGAPESTGGSVNDVRVEGRGETVQPRVGEVLPADVSPADARAVVVDQQRLVMLARDRGPNIHARDHLDDAPNDRPVEPHFHARRNQVVQVVFADDRPRHRRPVRIDQDAYSADQRPQRWQR